MGGTSAHGSYLPPSTKLRIILPSFRNPCFQGQGVPKPSLQRKAFVVQADARHAEIEQCRPQDFHHGRRAT